MKTDISRIGTSPSGVPIYIFRYIWGGPLYLGTMAQDLLATHPEAVIETASGYYMVDYTKLDIRMRALPEQAAGRHPAIVAGDVSEPRALVDDRVALPHGPLSREPGGPRRCHQQVSDRQYELS